MGAGGRAPVAGIVLNDFGVVAFYLLSLFARRLGRATSGQQLLLVELEQTRAAQAQAAALAERQRLAREMHDVLAHSLSGLVLNLEGARLLAEPGRRRPAGQRRDRPGPPAGQDRAGRGAARDRHAPRRRAARPAAAGRPGRRVRGRHRRAVPGHRDRRPSASWAPTAG